LAPATPPACPLSLHDALPIFLMGAGLAAIAITQAYRRNYPRGTALSLATIWRTFKSASWGLMTPVIILGGIFSGIFTPRMITGVDRKSTRLNSSHVSISYAVF